MKYLMTNPGITDSLADALAVCEREHGHEGNPATVYGHHGSLRTCIKIKETSQWVYNPAWETK